MGSDVSDLKQRISDLAGLMEEFHLAEAEWESEGERVSFRRRSNLVVAGTYSTESGESAHEEHVFPVDPEPVPAWPSGVPLTSPMTGIFYLSQSPNAPPFVQIGQTVSPGQVVGLIEAMKVFNEITAPTGGVVLSIVAESGQIVQPGDPLMYVG